VKIVYTKESVEKAASQCNSINQMLIYFGLTCSGGNWAGMKNRLINFNIDYSHFFNVGARNRKIYRTNTIEDFARVWDSSKQINTHYIKKGLIKLGALENKCYSCGITQWMEKPISLELHHKNGNRWDNRIENLETLCPNCHSVTANYKGLKNKRKG
jgi:hypothetical protein